MGKSSSTFPSPRTVPLGPTSTPGASPSLCPTFVAPISVHPYQTRQDERCFTLSFSMFPIPALCQERLRRSWVNQGSLRTRPCRQCGQESVEVIAANRRERRLTLSLPPPPLLRSHFRRFQSRISSSTPPSVLSRRRRSWDNLGDLSVRPCCRREYHTTPSLPPSSLARSPCGCPPSNAVLGPSSALSPVVSSVCRQLVRALH